MRKKNAAAQNHGAAFSRAETHGKISQEQLYTEIYRKNAAAQNHGAHFVRACAVETHVNMSQEPLYTEIYRKNAAAQNHGAHFARAWAVKMHFNMSREPLHTKIYGNNAAAQNHGANFVRACAVETHVKISQGPLYAEIHQESAAAQNHGAHFVRACAVETHAKISLCRNLQENAAAQIEPRTQTHPEWAPWSSTDLYTYRKNPSVQFFCLEKNACVPNPQHAQNTLTGQTLALDFIHSEWGLGEAPWKTAMVYYFLGRPRPPTNQQVSCFAPDQDQQRIHACTPNTRTQARTHPHHASVYE